MSIMSEYAKRLKFLRPNQLQALPYIQWLISGEEKDRRTGRSLVLATAFVWEAANRGWVDVFDHPPGNRKGGLSIIRGLLSTFPSFPKGMNLSSDGRLTLYNRELMSFGRSKVQSPLQIEELKRLTSSMLESGFSGDEIISLVKEEIVKSTLEK